MTGARPTADDAALAADLVREAGTLARRLRAGGLAAEQKTEVSDLVTAADRGAEELVTRALARERPEDGLLGEEGAERASRSGRTWVVDPVDGTYNFVAGLDWWCSALALRDEADVLLGAVHHPATGTTYVGGPGLPTTRDGVALAPIRDVPLAEACAATYLHPPFHGGEVGRAFARVSSRLATWRSLGSSSMDATAVAAGTLHLVFQHSLPPWDLLPGAALIRGAGGAAEQVEAAGVRWYVAGAPTAVAQACAALSSR